MTASLVILCALLVVVLAPALWPKRKPRPRTSDEDDVVSNSVGIIAIEDAIDLHGYRPREIADVVRSYLEAAAAKGLSEVRLIHGRGKGVQRQRVRELLASHALVERFADAPAHRGGWGATLVFLKVRRAR